MKKEYMEAFSEVYEIFKLMPQELLNKIPKKFYEIIKEERDKEYLPNIKEPIENQKLKDETIILLGLIYRDFLCSQDEKKRLQEKDARDLKEAERILEAELREKYNPDNIFKKNREEIEPSNEEIAMIEYKEQSFLKRLFEKIKSLFKKKVTFWKIFKKTLYFLKK